MKLEDIQIVCNTLKDKQSQLKALQEQMKALAEEIRGLSEDTIPAMLEEIGLAKITLQDGSTISTAMDVAASIPADQRPAALDWLDRHGHGDLIKTKVLAHFQRDQRDAALDLEARLMGSGYDVTLDESVHPMTLKAWLKEQLSLGADVPLELFGARQYYKTVVKNPK